ncbi:MAG: hypothetical protein ACOX9E_16040, partial [Lentisphaeria bacterium]
RSRLDDSASSSRRSGSLRVPRLAFSAAFPGVPAGVPRATRSRLDSNASSSRRPCSFGVLWRRSPV